MFGVGNEGEGAKEVAGELCTATNGGCCCSFCCCCSCGGGGNARSVGAPLGTFTFVGISESVVECSFEIGGSDAGDC